MTIPAIFGIAPFVVVRSVPVDADGFVTVGRPNRRS